MYLTQDEFIILSSIKMGLSRKELKEKFNIEFYTNDPRLSSLYKKYGVKNRIELNKIADFKKVEVVDIDKIPYFQYELIQPDKKIYSLVQKIKLKKEDIIKLAEFIKENKLNEEYELIYDNINNIHKTLELKEFKTGKKHVISSTVDV